jgi:lipid-binding SYLF domain-containing protein
MIMRCKWTVALSAAAIFAAGIGCESSYRASVDDPAERRVMHQQAQAAIDQFKQQDPSIEQFFDTAYGYAIFPSVAKGGVGIGGARGHGQVYEQGRFVGYATLTQGTIGPQLGGQTYSQIIFFEDQAAMDRFKNGGTEFAAGASAVAASRGASRNVDYDRGVAVFTAGEGGLMFEAAIGGQQFSFRPAEDVDPATGLAIPAERRYEQDVELDQ